MEITLSNEIVAFLEEVEADSKIYEAKNFIQRSRSIDQIDFYLPYLESSNGTPDLQDGKHGLRKYAVNLKTSLEAVDNRMFASLKNQLASSDKKGELLTGFLQEYCAFSIPESGEILGYDETDTFLNGLLASGVHPEETVTREPEMIYYQKTPARIIQELIKRAQFTTGDVFFDIGCGLGQPIYLRSGPIPGYGSLRIPGLS